MGLFANFLKVAEENSVVTRVAAENIDELEPPLEIIPESLESEAGL